MDLHRIVNRYASSTSRVSSIAAGDLSQLIENQVEFMADDLSHEDRLKAIGKVKVTPLVKEKAEAFDNAVEHALTEWFSKHMSTVNIGEGPLSRATTAEDVVNVLMKGRRGASFLYYMEHEETDVGTWDGDWDIFFKAPRPTIKILSQHVLRATKQRHKSLHEAILDAALDTMPDGG